MRGQERVHSASSQPACLPWSGLVSSYSFSATRWQSITAHPALPWRPLQNAAVVGGMLGALWGAAAIPPALAQPVLSYKYPAEGLCPGHPQLETLQACHIPRLVQELLRAGAG